MYNAFLVSHSFFRWLVVISLLVAIIVGLRGWITKKEFTSSDDKIRHWTAIIIYIQFLLGLGLYFISPIIRHFLNNFEESMKLREIRFFGIEHSLMMFIAVGIISTGTAKAKKKLNDKDKFKTMTIFYIIGFVIILLSIPWEFSSFVSRPYFRLF